MSYGDVVTAGQWYHVMDDKGLRICMARSPKDSTFVLAAIRYAEAERTLREDCNCSPDSNPCSACCELHEAKKAYEAAWKTRG